MNQSANIIRHVLPAVIPLFLGAAAPAVAQMEAGTQIPLNIDTPQDYDGSRTPGEPRAVWRYVLSHPDATYIAIHFVDFDLGPGDYLLISDEQGGQEYVLVGKGKMDAGTFWAQHVKGDTVVLELVAVGERGGHGFLIDEYVAGYIPLDGDRAICGADDKRSAKCYETSHPTEYDRGRAVARLLINGRAWCTGWLVSDDNLLLTNEHCITSEAEALNTDYEFMAESPDCISAHCSGCWPGTIFSGGTLIQDSANLDYALVRVTSGDPASVYGFLEIDNRDAVPGEEIYIPQHPLGFDKQFAIDSTDPHDPGGLCTVHSVTEPPCSGGGYNDVGYFADTEGGSSGSPVLARSSHQVIALHHCRDCPNRGVPIDLIYAEISPFLTSENTPPILSNPRVSPISGTESTQFEFMVDYYDADGDPPHPTYRKVYVTGGLEATMTLKSGAASNGTYHYTTTLSAGSYSYCFLFADINYASDMTPWQNGPDVYIDDNIVINPVIQCTRISSNIKLGYSLTGLGNWIWMPIGDYAILDPIIFPPDSTIWFNATVASLNHEHTWWELWEQGSIIQEGSSSIWGITFSPGAEGEYGLDVFYQYTPQEYTINGTVLRGDGTPVPGGVDLTLTSAEQAMFETTTDGNFSFTGVRGGVSVAVEPSAAAYAFVPSNLTYSYDLSDDPTAESITAYASDTFVPMTSFLAVPPAVSEDSSVLFSWIGQDDVTPTEDLLYQYKLDPVDAEWSNWASDTSTSYDLPNGVYTFWVRAKDEAENINQAPANYTFVVNAAPQVTATTRISKSVWATRLTLEMPPGATQPTDTFVLLLEHSDMTDSDLIPVTLHYAGDATPCGANEIIADELGLTARVLQASTGWQVMLPDSIAPGETAEYDVVLGKIAYFGWQEFVSVPDGFPNGGSNRTSYLNDDLRVWRDATKTDANGPGACDNDNWLFMDIADHYGMVVDETILRYVPGECWGGDTGTMTELYDVHILKINANICYLWEEDRYVFDGVTDYWYNRYALQFFDSSGAPLGSVFGSEENRAYPRFPHGLIHGSLWITGRTWSNPEYAWFVVLDEDGNEICPRTVFDTLQNDNGVGLYPQSAYTLGDNVLFLWERCWDTDDNDERCPIMYQVRDTGYGIVVPTTELSPPLLPDSVEKDDVYMIVSVLSDSNGRVWVSYWHQQSGEPTTYHYLVLDTDGMIWQGPFQTPSSWGFPFCDRDGKVWVLAGGQFFVMDANSGQQCVAPRTPAYAPNQHFGTIAASVGGSGYRLYDRWSPQYVEIDVPGEANANAMDLYDLNMWDNDLHPANITLEINTNSVPFPPGQFTGHATVDVTGLLNEGLNLFTMTQDDFLGGQVLVTFPYIVCLVDEDCDDGVSCTIDTCDVDSNACVYTSDDSLCSNGVFCDGDEWCDPVNDCQPGTAPDCDDGIDCTDDSCNVDTDSCDHIPNDSLCPPEAPMCDADQGCVTTACCVWSLRGCLSNLTKEFCEDTLDGIYVADGTCPDACYLGACCHVDGSCEILIEAQCVDSNGAWQGQETDCASNPCTGACCLPGGTCLPDETAEDCNTAGGEWQGLGSTCDPNPCTGACCFPDGTCTLETTDDCSAAGGDWQGLGVECDPNPCPKPGACCMWDGSCEDLTETDCINTGGVAWGGEGTSCATYDCTGACCVGETCVPSQSPANCSSVSGQWAGPNTDCSDPNVCKGACCIGTVCVDHQVKDACLSVPGQWAGLFSNCATVECPLDDCNTNGVFDEVDIALGTSLDANENGIPDECEVPANLQSSFPTHEQTLWRTANNFIRLTFNADITTPADGELLIEVMNSNGEFGQRYTIGTNGLANFNVEVTTNGSGDLCVLEIWENGSVLTHTDWIAVHNIGGWDGVAEFHRHYPVVKGDVNGDGDVLPTDFGPMFPKMPTFGSDPEERADVNGDRDVLPTDFGPMFPQIPTFGLNHPKPSGH